MEDAILKVMRKSPPEGVSDHDLRRKLGMPEESTYVQERELHNALKNLSDIGLINTIRTPESVWYILTR